MIPPARRALFLWLFGGHARRRFTRTFLALRVRGLDAARQELSRAPLLVVSNHCAWWDPLLALLLSRLLGAEAYAMMDAKNLRKLPFFRWIGAFGVDLDDPRDGARAVRFAAGLLDRPGRLVWIFAQGEERASTLRPLGFQAGSAVVARLAPSAVVVPASLRYEFGPHERPTAFVSFGPAVSWSSSSSAASSASRPKAPVEELRAAHERAVEAELEATDRALRTGALGPFAVALGGEARPLAAFFERALAVLSGRHGRSSRRDPTRSGTPRQ